MQNEVNFAEKKVKILILDLFSRLSKGGSGENLRKVCRKFVPGVIRYPPTIFFHKLRFFSSAFSGPTNFFPQMQIFSSEIWRPTHIFTENSYFPIFWPFDWRHFSVFESLFLYIRLFDEFYSFFWVHKHVKSLKMIHFLSTFSRNDHNFSLMHHGKNVQDHGKKLQIGLFGTHQISIPSANFCLTPPRDS